MKPSPNNLLVNGSTTQWSSARTKDELWMASASTLDGLLTRKEISPVEILTSVLARIEEVDFSLNAFCYLAVESAKRSARESEARTSQGARLSPLDGIPVHIKDNVFVAGMPCTWGSRLYQNYVPDVDDLPVAALRNAGAVLIGKTNTPEFALMAKTENALFGTTLNPWNVSRTPGGSSGGAATAVAAGMGPLALATDAGGSIRRPASYCGVVGLKTSLGTVARGMGFPATVHDFQTIGPIARDVADARLLFETIAPSQRTGEAEQGDASRITVLDEASLGVIEPDVAECLRGAVEALGELGLTVSHGPGPWNLQQIESLWQVFSSVGVARIADHFDSQVWVDKATQQAQELAIKGRRLDAVDYVHSLDELRKLRYQAEHEWFRSTQFMMMPTAPSFAWPVEQPYPDSISGQKASPRACSIFATFINAAGLPALNVPAGLSRTGLPIGIQLVGPPGADMALLKLGRRLERIFRHREKMSHSFHQSGD